MSNYQVLIFDWDGTLVDSIGRIVESIHVAARNCGLPQIDDGLVKGIIGLALPEAIAVLYPDQATIGLIEDFRHCYSEHYLALETEPSALYPGVAEALSEFRDAGYLLAVATGKGRRGLDRVLAGQGWEDFFDITRCADETASKPDPRMVQEILAHCGARPEQALMVGDSVFDLQMARRAGVDSVAVSYGAQPLHILQRYEPRAAINHFSELRSWLRSVAGTEVNVNVG
ncbi:HAD-IA family hydrolase [Pseudomonas stutzeri]|uniref:HAD family hydrolase n=1 Tax=Stutzerimonas stutzeri TaxID=316 RepID=A0A2N8S733_STUST|nr:HAD-IA family hydrolase [Stutzerimonas stutzeri]MCQ4294745.1 HAD-IA family hydrolase [Stutzerimonas stutzeri]PNF82433.1 HAD family hydrolase [Stutzerimonas stutzeri]